MKLLCFFFRFLVAMCLFGMAFGDEWRFQLDAKPSAEQVIDLAGMDWSEVDRLRVVWHGSELPADSRTWLEFVIVSSDGRWFVSAASLAVWPHAPDDRIDVPLESGWWAGRDGSLAGDAVSSVRELRVRLHGGNGGTVAGSITTLPRGAVPRFAVESESQGLIERTTDLDQPLWREWRVRLVGDLRGSTGIMDLLRSDGSRLPLFLEQPAVVVDGAWKPYGSPRWVLRLRIDETMSNPVRLAWQSGERQWTSQELSLPTQVAAHERLAVMPAAAMAIPLAPAWQGHPAQASSAGFLRIEAVELKPCPAPALIWRADWTGFRGPHAVGHLQALAVDRVLAEAQEIDLLPAWLAQEHGSFRFGLAPWHVSAQGPWEYVQDVLSDDVPWRDWRRAVRELLARGRAAPQIKHWRLGLTATANDDGQVARLISLQRDIAGLVADIDGRPLLSQHPQVVPFVRSDPSGLWAGFEGVHDEWRADTSIPFGSGATLSFSDEASQGKKSLILPMVSVERVRIGGLAREVDANVMNLDRLTFDARCSGSGHAAVQWYAWCTDRHHRWYQQRLEYVQTSPRWNTLAVEFDTDAAWQPVGHRQSWDGTQRQQLRRLGIVAFVHGDTDHQVVITIDRVRRFGWPSQAQPALTIADLVIAPAPLTRYAPIAADFRLSLAAVNPYDPEQADVVGEVEAPDGTRSTFPAYWAEPFDLTFTDGKERAVPIGTGAWHWRFSPPTAGVWRWRITAMVKWQERQLRTESAWQTCSVPERLPMLQPIRKGLKDPRWFERVDGTWWYPIGMNLRSPSDTLQDKVLRMQAAGQTPDRSGEPLTYTTRGWSSADFERLGTCAYARWFARMEHARMNWARVWMCPWWCGLEWSRKWDEYGGLVVYNQAGAARLDRVMALAAQHGVYVQLELQNHGMTSQGVDRNWDPSPSNPGSPYSRRNGGPCNSPADYYRREEAWTIHEKRLRYTLARWGHLSNLAALVLTSEMEFTGDWWEVARNDDDHGHAEATAAWVRRSLAWFRQRDPQQRPVTIHFSHPWRGSQMWREPELGFSNSNAYTGFQSVMQRLGGAGTGLDGALEFYLDQHFPPWQLNRPTLIGEWGGHWADNSVEALNQELHTGVWMQAAMPYGGNTGYWWWMLVDAADTWHEYQAVLDFAQADDPRGRDLRTARAPASNPQVKAIGAASADLHRYYVWIAGLDQAQRPNLAEAGSLRIATAQPQSRWSVQRWDCQTGSAHEVGIVTAATDGMVTLILGQLTPDAAFTLRRIHPAIEVGSPASTPPSTRSPP